MRGKALANNLQSPTFFVNPSATLTCDDSLHLFQRFHFRTLLDVRALTVHVIIRAGLVCMFLSMIPNVI